MHVGCKVKSTGEVRFVEKAEPKGRRGDALGRRMEGIAGCSAEEDLRTRHNPFGTGCVGNPLELDRDNYYVIVNDVIMLKVGAQRERCGLEVRVQKR
jgi:hypothetical protein